MLISSSTCTPFVAKCQGKNHPFIVATARSKSIKKYLIFNNLATNLVLFSQAAIRLMQNKVDHFAARSAFGCSLIAAFHFISRLTSGDWSNRFAWRTAGQSRQPAFLQCPHQRQGKIINARLLGNILAAHKRTAKSHDPIPMSA